MIEINLIPDVKQELIRAQKARAMVTSISIITSIITVGVVVLLAFYVFAVQNARSAILDGSIDSGAKELSEVADLSKILTIQNQLSEIDSLNSQKSLTSRVFDTLSAVTPPSPNDVMFSRVSVDTESKGMRLEGQTIDFGSMEVFKKTLDSAIIVYTNDDGEETSVKLASDISTSDVSYGEDANGTKVLRFTLDFTYAEELYSMAVADPLFKLGVDGNVTDSYLGIPRSLFTDRAKDI